MPAGGQKSMAFLLLAINLAMYFIVTVIAGWAINHSIESMPQTAASLEIPVRLFPIYFPMGNMATGFFVVFSLIAGLVGIASSITGLNNIVQWNVANLMSAATFSIIAWGLTVLAMGLACKEINIGGRDGALRTLEALTVILSGTQLLCVGAIHAGIPAVSRSHPWGGAI
ncbi:membrane protein PM19L [Magnolia sinica]|uniref:membrane protein PM19L n=1 Tax=Magnolia sinica TaxID=86752 RepID=UPI002657D64C|nr:membrane protein PM19L [Magnolia sinica]